MPIANRMLLYQDWLQPINPEGQLSLTYSVWVTVLLKDKKTVCKYSTLLKYIYILCIHIKIYIYFKIAKWKK